MHLFASIVENSILGAAVVSGTAAVVADAALRPESQLFGRTLIAGHDPREVALTFDDGPNDRDTSALLDLFAEHDVKATFFMIGRFVRERAELARRVYAAGHVVGNHTVTHPWLAWQSAARIREELRTCNEILEDAIGARIVYFRPPHGARRPVVMRTARELGLTTVQWNVMGADWLPIGEQGILANLRKGMKSSNRRGVGANILLHDGGDRAMGTDRSATVAVVKTLLRELPGEGKRFVTLDTWR